MTAEVEPPPRVVCVGCVDWPVVAARLGEPRWAHRPVAVLERGRVVAASKEARVAGVRRGMRRREAEAACGDLMVVGRDPTAEARWFEPVVAATGAVAARLVVDRPGLLYLPARGPARFFGGEAALCDRLRAVVRDAIGDRWAAATGSVEGAVEGAPEGAPVDRPAPVRVGVADGVFPARLAARRDTVVPSGRTAAFLAPWPVEVLGDADLAGLLRRLGVPTLGDFAALPAPAVLARFGPAGLVAHRRASGRDPTPLLAAPPEADLTEAFLFDPPAEGLEPVAFAARRLAARFLERLETRGRSCLQVTVVVETADGRRCARTWRHDPLGASVLADRVRWQLEGWLSGTAGSPPEAGVRALVLVPEVLGPPVVARPGLWGGDGGRADRAARVVARLQGRFGPDAVTRLVPQGGRSPAERVRRVPWGEPAVPHRPEAPVRGPVTREAPAWPGRLPGPAPARVFDPPVPARFLDTAGRAVRVGGRGEPSAAPAWLAAPVLEDRALAVRAWDGPWPHDVRWWDRRAHRRGAFWQVVVERAPGSLLTCLVRTQGDHATLEALHD